MQVDQLELIWYTHRCIILVALTLVHLQAVLTDEAFSTNVANVLSRVAFPHVG